MEEIIYKIDDLTIVKLLGGLGIIIGLSITYFSKIVLGRLSHSYDKKLEGVKGEISKGNDTLNSFIQNQFSFSQKIFDKRVQAYEFLWAEMLAIRAKFPAPVNLFFMVTLDKEIEQNDIFQKVNNSKRGEALRACNRPNSEIFLEGGERLMKEKPYITDHTFKLFFAYRAFIARLTDVFLWNFENGVIYNWKKDDHMFSLFNIVLDKDELSYIKQIPMDSVNAVLDLIEYKIMQDFRKQLFVTQSPQDAVGYLKDLETILNPTKKS